MLGLNREWLSGIYLQGLAKVSGKPLVQNWLAQHSCTAPYYLIAIGKAAAAMAAGFRDVAGEHCRAALVITKHGHLQPWLSPAEHWLLLESSHPVPDQTSLDAGTRLLTFVSQLPSDAKLYVLISGGASSLVELLCPAIQLDDLQRANEYLLANDFSIDQMNAVRSCLSMIKGGGLLALFKQQSIQCLLISDVPNDRLAVIGSGLMVNPVTDEAWRSLILPTWLRDLCLLGQASRWQQTSNIDIEYELIGTLEQAKQSIARLAVAQGIKVMVQAEFLRGDPAQVAKHLVAMLKTAAPGLYIWGGETSLHLPDGHGIGGRNQHFALCAAQAMADTDNLLLLAVGTDGTDGPTPYAGGLVDGSTVARGQSAGKNSTDAIATANSTDYLRATNDLVETGPTGTNLMDLVLGYKWGSE